MGAFKFNLASLETIEQLLARNKVWAKVTGTQNPGLYESNAKGQNPPVLWIGCADSRISEHALDVLPGEVFVHRNAGNIVSNNDMNCQSILQMAMQVVGCKHIIVCGHTCCKGIEVALTKNKVGGPLEVWLRNLREVRAKYLTQLEAIEDPTEKANAFVKYNVIEQVYNVRKNDYVREHMQSRGVQVHGLVYDVSSGLLDLVDIPECETESIFDLDPSSL
ncbi:carbonate dehydratase [Starmerella bacillaris]|uniref:Carbonic anhydrase n=1 Tax=Starmerella bacillaris TaxID=1247836 RepID=A0AAV5RDP9_STABA|nr:carbonate dehydratase [Starmerella bacillaris]